MDDFIRIAAVVFLIFLIIQIWQSKRKPGEETTVGNVRIFSEEDVYKTQSSFENQLQYTEVPDSIPGKNIYIYRNLMLPWFGKLSGENRYDGALTQKLRVDWVDYIGSLQEWRTCGFLASEEYGKDEAKAKQYDERAGFAHEKTIAIENAFANSIGENAIKELERIRALDMLDYFNNLGVLAPEGFKYDIYGKELIKIK